jgi:DNA helicase-2/ATP-dependent DNA helicase PcrA
MSVNNEIKEDDTLAFLNKLNKQQQEAVTHCNSPQLVLSGAGSGKTRVLTNKIVYLIKIMNIRPYNILALTFTNKAANEMKQRITKLIGEEYAKNIHMGTFHSIFLKILRRNISFLGDKKYKPNFQIIDEDDTKKMIRNILEERFDHIVQNIISSKGVNDRINSSIIVNSLVRKITEKIMLLKNRGITYEEYYKLNDEIKKDEVNGFVYLKNVYQIYVEECKKKNVMDFEDLLLNTFLLFKNNISILQRYQQLYKYILVDEFQDTNHVQFEILKALSWQSHNICGVGDDCQSIYSFRGADIINFNHFLNSFPKTEIIQLNRNYRSASNIVKLADLLIKNNKNQIEKNLYSSIDSIDGKIKLLINENGIEEAEKIGFIINNLVNDKRCEYKDIAILYRMNLQSYPFQKIFFRRNIPHKLCNRIGFYETKIIQNIFAYLKFLINPLDIWLNKIIDYPKRGIGVKTKKNLFSLAKANNISGWEIINNCDNKEKINEYKIDNKLQNALLPFKNMILNLQSFLNIKSVYAFVLYLIEIIELRKFLANDSSSLEKINMLLEKIEESEQEYNSLGSGKYTLDIFLDETSLLLGNEENYDSRKTENNNKVRLMTIHQAKGLEFEYVFVVGLEEEFYPSKLSSGKDLEIEEERRILYVAITRAKKNCYLSYANTRLIGDKESKRIVSRFLNEIYNNDLIEIYNSPEFKDYLEKNKALDKKNKRKENRFLSQNSNKKKDIKSIKLIKIQKKEENK